VPLPHSVHTTTVVALLAYAVLTTAQENVKPGKDVTRAATMAVPIDPATLIDSARKPRGLGRRELETLGLTPEQIDGARTTVYAATRLADDAGELAVFASSVVKQGDRRVFWSADLPKSVVRGMGEVQISFETVRDARYLVDFALDSAEQSFAVVSGETRTTQAPDSGHIALVVSGTGKRHKVRLIPLGDEQFTARRFTLFEVAVTPID